MIGLPNQTEEDLVNDILFYKDMNIDMIGMGPYILHKDTPLGQEWKDIVVSEEKRVELGLKMIAITRIFLKDVNIAATTALQGLDPQGREKGLLAGANILMPTATALEHKNKYLLYDNKPGINDSDDAIEQGLSSAHMPARIEVMRRHPLLLLDGCHNPDGARVLAETLTKAEYEENLVGVMGMLADKDYKAMLSDLAPCFAKVFTVTPACPRALSAEALQKEARFHLDAEAAASVPEALHKALDYCEENNLAGVVVCGSLYLAAEARPLMLKEAEN